MGSVLKSGSSRVGQRGEGSAADDDVPLKVGDAVEARCAGYGKKGGYWPAVVINAVSTPSEPQKFVIRWLQDPQVDTVKTAAELRRRRPCEWLTKGSARLGKRIRRGILSDEGCVTSYADGTVVGFLPARHSEFVSDYTQLPAALWRVKYDSAALGEEDLEQVELEEALHAWTKSYWAHMSKISTQSYWAHMSEISTQQQQETRPSFADKLPGGEGTQAEMGRQGHVPAGNLRRKKIARVLDSHERAPSPLAIKKRRDDSVADHNLSAETGELPPAQANDIVIEEVSSRLSLMRPSPIDTLLQDPKSWMVECGMSDSSSKRASSDSGISTMQKANDKLMVKVKQVQDELDKIMGKKLHDASTEELLVLQSTHISALQKINNMLAQRHAETEGGM